MSEWKEYTIGQAPLEIIDGDRGKNYPSQDEFSNNGHCLFLSTKNVRLTGFDFYECQFISKDKDALLRKGKLNRNDLVLTTRGTIGNIGFYSENVPFQNMRINSGMVIIRPFQNEISPIFNYYIFRFLQKDFLTYTSGSAQPQLPIRDLNQISFLLPPLPEQTAIAEVLSSLDDKIDLLHRQNKTLEQLAETLFRQWFVEEAEESWEEGKLEDFINVKYGKDHKKVMDGNIPVYGSGGIMRYGDKSLYDKESILIPRKGSLNNIVYIDDPFWTVDTMFYTEMRKSNAAKFVFHFLKRLDLASMNVGSAVPSMTTEVLNNMPILIPSDLALAEFESIVSELYKKIKSNTVQINTLIRLRDILLPKLMSGEVRVNN